MTDDVAGEVRQQWDGTAVFLHERLAKAKALGHEYVQLVVGRRGGNSPRYWDRCRVISGKHCLMGRCIGAGNVMGTWLFDVKVAELEAWLKKRGQHG